MTARSQRKADHWKRLGLVEGAPERAIEAAWLYLIAEHHPDRGGDTATARAINVAHDELKGAGANANEYVAAHYDAQPWLVLGVLRGSGDALAQRVGRELATELRRTHRRLAERVDWAMANFSRVTAAPPAPNGARIRVTPPTPPPRQRPAPLRRPAAPSHPGIPEGLPRRIDFGTAPWREAVERSFKLTWKQFAPYEVTVDTPAPVTAEVVSSKALPGRFAVSLSIDWDSDVFSHDPARRGVTLDDDIVLRWGGGGEALVRTRGVLLYPAHIAVAPAELDLGARDVNETARASLAVSSSAPASVEVQPPAWLERINAEGRALDGPLHLEANVGMRIEFAVRWPPIAERGAASFSSGRAVRPTGRITLRWDGRTVDVPVQMTVRPPKSR